MDVTQLPIGFMDSGLGGLSVLRQAMRLLPNENYYYYGDSANAPYGTRPVEQVRELAFAVVEHLLEVGVKAIVVACNTATSAAIRELRAAYPELPILGVEPAIKPAVEQCRGGRVLMLATPATVRQEMYQQKLALYAGRAEIVSVPCPGLMEFVERGELDTPALQAYFAQLLPEEMIRTVTCVVLGCTHYPFLTAALQRCFAGRDVQFLDGSFGTARHLGRRLEEAGLRRREETPGQLVIANSSPDPTLIERSRWLLAQEW